MSLYINKLECISNTQPISPALPQGPLAWVEWMGRSTPHTLPSSDFLWHHVLSWRNMSSLLEYVGYVHIYLGPYRGNPIALYLKRTESGCQIGPKVYPWNDVLGTGKTPNKAAADFEEKWKARGLPPDMYSGPSWEGSIKPERPAPTKPVASAPSASVLPPSSVPVSQPAASPLAQPEQPATTSSTNDQSPIAPTSPSQTSGQSS